MKKQKYGTMCEEDYLKIALDLHAYELLLAIRIRRVSLNKFLRFVTMVVLLEAGRKKKVCRDCLLGLGQSFRFPFSWAVLLSTGIALVLLLVVVVVCMWFFYLSTTRTSTTRVSASTLLSAVVI